MGDAPDQLTMIDDRFLLVLREIFSRLKGTSIPWVVTGSLGMALQGMDLDVNDIDLQTTSDGAYEIEKAFSEYIITPVSYKVSDRLRSHLGKLEISGVEVEIMGSIQKRLENDTWEEPVDIRKYRLWVRTQGMRIPVLSLEHEYQAYLIIGRKDKAEQLRSWLSSRKKRSNSAAPSA
jgi:hypothetical protein